MKRSHPLWIIPLALLLMLVPLTSVTLAQEATPSTDDDAAIPTSPVEGPILTLAPEAYFPGEGSTASPGGDLPGDPQIELVQVAGGFHDPVNVASPPDGSGRLFVVERPGTIRIIDANGQVLEEPFLDISDQVLHQFLEDGLLDLVFDPNYAENGYFYLDYTSLLYNGDVYLMRYQVSPDDPNQADPDSGEVIMFRDQRWANHVGGSLVFGPDGYLYVGVGDGGLEGDPLETGQNINDLYGSILRIDVHPENDEERYAIPPDNPFADAGSRPVDLFALTEEDFAQFHTDARPEIWLWGLRNPWQFSFDRANGDLYIADVGQNFYEEIHYLPAGQTGGQNLGWDIMEASHCFPVSIEYCAKVGLLPVAEYAHEQGCSITGVDVYRGEQFATLDGIYFASDYCSGRVWGLARDDAGTWQFEELLDTRLFVTGSGTGENGDLYLTSCICGYGTVSQPEGSVWRIVSSDQVPEGAQTAERETEAATPEAEASPQVPE